MNTVVFPELGEGIEKATVACWHTFVGRDINEGDDLVDLVTDKASFTVPAGFSGVVEKICVGEGQEIRLGETLAVIKPRNRNKAQKND